MGSVTATDKTAPKKPVAVGKPKEDHAADLKLREERMRPEKAKAERERLANLEKLKAEEEAEVAAAQLKAKEQRQDQEELADKQALEREAKAAQAKKEAEEKLRRINGESPSAM